MSDDLLDFFARKDRKKDRKKKDKYAKIEIVQSEMETDLPSEENKIGIDSKESDGEWVETKPLEVDFSNLQFDGEIIENGDTPEANPNEVENVDGQIEEKEKSQGWKIPVIQAATTNGINQKEEETVKKVASSYVPPSLRKKQMASKPTIFVNNAEEFPTLNK